MIDAHILKHEKVIFRVHYITVNFKATIDLHLANQHENINFFILTVFNATKELLISFLCMINGIVTMFFKRSS